MVDAHTVALATGQRFTTRHILIATGGWPFVPDVPGKELAVTSNEMFHLDQLPRRALIVGGGFIACEFAGILNGLGVQVTQWYRGEQILRGFDDEARGHVAKAMIAQGIDLRVNTDVARLDRSETGIRATALDGGTSDYDLVLYATGRKAQHRRAGAGGRGCGTGPRRRGQGGRLVADRCALDLCSWRCDQPREPDPVAIREGHAFADTVFRGVPTKFEHKTIASAVFTQPELGTVGLTEEGQGARPGRGVFRRTFRPMKTLFAGRGHRMLMKLLVSQSTRKVLGCHIVGEGAGEMIQLAAVAVRWMPPRKISTEPWRFIPRRRKNW